MNRCSDYLANSCIPSSCIPFSGERRPGRQDSAVEPRRRPALRSLQQDLLGQGQRVRLRQDGAGPRHVPSAAEGGRRTLHRVVRTLQEETLGAGRPDPEATDAVLQVPGRLRDRVRGDSARKNVQRVPAVETLRDAARRTRKSF